MQELEEFKIRLEKALLIANMKPIDLCRKTGLSQALVSQYRSGYTEPKRDKIALIAEALGVNPAWLAGFDVPDDKMKNDRDRVMKAYDSTDDLTKQMVKRLLGLEV